MALGSKLPRLPKLLRANSSSDSPLSAPMKPSEPV